MDKENLRVRRPINRSEIIDLSKPPEMPIKSRICEETGASVSKFVESEVSKLTHEKVIGVSPEPESSKISSGATVSRKRGTKKERTSKSNMLLTFTLDEDTKPYLMMLCAALDLPLFGINRLELKEQTSRVVNYSLFAAFLILRQWQKENHKLTCTPEEFVAYLLKQL